MLTVKKLIEILSKLENQDIPIYFTYDSRVCCPRVTCVDLVPNGDLDHRIFASDFISEKQQYSPTQSIILRSENKDDYEYHNPNYLKQTDNEYIEEIRKDFNYWREHYLKSTHPEFHKHSIYTDDYLERRIKESIETRHSNIEETKNDVNLYLEDYNEPAK